MPTRRSVLLLAIAAWASLAVSGAGAQTTQPDARLGGDPPLLPDLARIVERGTLVVAQVNQDLPPMFAATDGGELEGFDIAMAHALAEFLGTELEIRRTAESYDEVVWQVAAGEADLGISFLSRTVHRARHVLFSRPYARQRMTLLINRMQGLAYRQSCPTVAELSRTAELTGLLGLEQGSAYAERLREVNPDAEPREFVDSEDLMAAVLAGEVSISLQGELAARRYLSENPATRIRLHFCVIGRLEDQIAIAVPPGRDDLLRWVNVFLEAREIDFDAAALNDHEGPWSF